MPSGAVEYQHSMSVGGQAGGEFIKEDLHGFGRDRRQDQGNIIAIGGADGSKDVGRFKAPVAQPARTLATQPSAMTGAALLADTGFIHEPKLDPPVGVVLRDGGYGVA
jgi:hypothetical protein